MPTLETADGQPVDVTPVDTAAINAKFNATMADDGPDDQAPPKRAPKAAPDEAPKRGPGRPRKTDQARTTAKPAVTLDDAQRATGVAGIAQIGAAALAMGAKATGSVALLADSLTIANAAPVIADACVQVAKTDQRFAAVLDKVCATGPYGALITMAVGVGAQLLRNHRPALSLPGTVHPDELFRSVENGQSPVASAA